MLITRKGSLTLGAPEVTGLKRTDDLTAGLFVYGTGIPVCTKVLSVDSGTEVTLTKNATVTTVSPVDLQFTSASPDLMMERCQGLSDVKGIVDERGSMVKVILRDEDDVTRDAYNSIKTRARERVLFMNAYPIEFTPSTKQLEKAGLREACQISLWTAMKDWITAGVDFEDIEFAGRTTVIVRGTTYEVRDKSIVSQIGDTWAYLTLGLFKR